MHSFEAYVDVLQKISEQQVKSFETQYLTIVGQTPVCFQCEMLLCLNYLSMQKTMLLHAGSSHEA